MLALTRKWGRHRQKWLGEGRASQMTQGNGDALQHGKGLLKKQDSDREEVRKIIIVHICISTSFYLVFKIVIYSID